ncbi:TetR/AcrR family transcriptional regulator, partial [candidate division KSB1 bacterium]|nr:TetR/AcrR family transcriptional regulator [candidate division KSB1 bacterium]
MPRIVKQHEQRRSEILDTAQHLFYTQGYEHTSIANVIDAIGIAKGTFYHYFKSKAELLDQIIDRQSAHIDQIIDRVLDEPEENAIVEMNNIWAEVSVYKAENKSVMLMMLRAIYREDNIVFRTKLTNARVKVVTPKIARVISRGIQEGLFFTGNPLDVADMILNLAVYMGEKIAKLILDGDLSSENKKRYLEKCQTYN